MNEIVRLLTIYKELDAQNRISYSLMNDLSRSILRERTYLHSQNRRTSPQLELLQKDLQDIRLGVTDRSEQKVKAQNSIIELVDSLIEKDEPVPGAALEIYTSCLL